MLELLDRRNGPRHGDVGALGRLAVAQRPQHHEHGRAERGEARGVRCGDDRQGADDGQVRQSDIHRRREARRELEAPAGLSGPFDGLADPRLRLVLHVKDVQLETELRHLVHRDRELHAGCGRGPGPPANDRPERAEQQPKDRDRDDQYQRPGGIDGERHAEQGDEVGDRHDTLGDAAHQAARLCAVRGQELLEAPRPLGLLHLPGGAEEGMAEPLPDLGDDPGGNVGRLPVGVGRRKRCEERQRRPQQEASNREVPAGHDAYPVLPLADSEGGPGDRDEEQRLDETSDEGRPSDPDDRPTVASDDKRYGTSGGFSAARAQGVSGPGHVAMVRPCL